MKLILLALTSMALSACVAPTEIKIDCQPTDTSRGCAVHVKNYGSLQAFDARQVARVVDEVK